MTTPRPERTQYPATARVAKFLRKSRKESRLSVQKLADRTGEFETPIRRCRLTELEFGRARSVSIDELLSLAAALGMPPEVLLRVSMGESVEDVPEIPLSDRRVLIAGALAAGFTRARAASWEDRLAMVDAVLEAIDAVDAMGADS